MSEPVGKSNETDRIYLDNNATTRPLPEVMDRVRQVSLSCFGNPGSRHAEGRQARRVLEESRESIARILGAHPSEVIFTSGGTEAINMAVFGLTGQTPGSIALTAGEHPATMESCKSLQQQGWTLHLLDVDQEGRLLEDASLPWDDLRLVTVILAHNETGVIQNLQPLAALCRRHQVPFHVDAVQAVGKIPVNFEALGVSSLALGAHKFHGPRGIGALLLRRDSDLTPQLFGGHQESDRRPGTEVVALAAGMARALELWEQNQVERTRKIQQMRDALQTGLLDRCHPAVVNGSQQHRLPNTLNISFPGIDGEALLVALDLEGIACSLGSTCSSGSAQPAQALLAMQCPVEVYRSAVRFSVSIDNGPEEIADAVLRIPAVVRRLRS